MSTELDDGLDIPEALRRAPPHTINVKITEKVIPVVPAELNAVGKPRSASYDPKYRMKYKPPTPAHLSKPANLPMVGDDIDRQAWVVKISAAWHRVTASIIETGELLIKAKRSLKHGSFGIMVDKALPFGARTAQRLMQIAEHPVLSNTTHASLLPPSWMTLYELSHVPPELLEEYLEEGRVHAKLERKEAAALRPGFTLRAPPPPPTDDEVRRELEAAQAHAAELEAAREQQPNGDIVEQCLRLFRQMSIEEAQRFGGGLDYGRCLNLAYHMNIREKARLVRCLNETTDAADLLLGIFDSLDEDECKRFIDAFNARNNGLHIAKKPVEAAPSLPDDGLDIPEYLRRAPTTEAAS
jgi:hypothetical protein